MPAHGGKPGSPIAVRTLKALGSSLPAPQGLPLVAQAGVTLRLERRMFSVSFGVVDVLVILTLVRILSPTFAVAGHVGTSPPATPAIAGTPLKSNVPSSAATIPSP